MVGKLCRALPTCLIRKHAEALRSTRLEYKSDKKMGDKNIEVRAPCIYLLVFHVLVNSDDLTDQNRNADLKKSKCFGDV